MKKFFLFAFTLFFCNISHADFFKTEDFAIALGLESKTLVHKRGIVTYGGYQVGPIYAINLFNPNFQLVGSSLYYKFNFTENFLIRTRLRTNATKDKPLYYTGENEGERIQREKTNELDIFLEYSSNGGHYLRFEISKDLTAHKGIYSEIHGRLALFDYPAGNGKALIQPGVFASIGYGDSKHNTYLYGSGAGGSSFNNMEYGFYVASPRVIDVFWTTFKLSRFQLLNQNKYAGYVQESNATVAELIFAFRVF